MNLRSELGARRHAAADDDRRARGRQAAGAARLRRRDGAADAARSAPTTSARGPATGSCASRCPARGAVTLTGEFNFAIGDENPTDGTRGTFDQLYPTPHDKYGLADQVGWRNIHHLRAGFELTPFKALPVVANYHSWWLAEKRDGALRRQRRAARARRRRRRQSRHVGQEIDVQVTRALTPQLQLAAGYAHIFTGAFLKQATPGASYSHPFVMVDLRLPRGEDEHDRQMHKTSRRTFLKAAGASTAGVLLVPACPRGWVGGVYAEDGPEDARRCASASSRSPTARRS